MVDFVLLTDLLLSQVVKPICLFISKVILKRTHIMTHLEEYLEYFSSLDAPGYAVLVTGAWGTGKTFQVSECIPESERIYVSLYGLQSVKQVHAEVFAAAHPGMAKARVELEKLKDKNVGALGVSIPLGFIPDIANAFLKNEVKPDRILIFDDLERSCVNLNEVLGAINSYVEHKGFNVIVIAHDDEELLGEDFRSIKEKIFGQTILIEPQIDKALDKFIRDIKADKAGEFVKCHKAQIKDVFQRSEAKSLRVLKHAVEDLTRLYSVLSNDHLKNTEAMRELVQISTAFGVEVRTGKLTEQDIRHRKNAQLAHLVRAQREGKAEAEVAPIIIANDKYPTLDLEEGMLNDDVLVSMFIEGRYQRDEIQKSINDSSHFIVPEEAPPWKVVIHFDELDDTVVEEARINMERQFENREVTNSGEMLHIFSLRMMMAEKGIIKQSVDEVVRDCKVYIDDLLARKTLPPRELDWRWYDEFDRSYDGFTYWGREANNKAFREIWDHLISSREQAFRLTMPEILKQLLSMVKQDSTAFLEAVSQTNNGDNPYALIPLLHEIPATDFVDAWLSGKNNSWKYVSYALENRFNHNRLENDLKAEKDWAFEVLKELEKRSKAEEGFRALRIERIRPNVLIDLARSFEK